MAPTTGSLFGHDEAGNTSLVQVLSRDKPAGKAQQQFQRLVGKIETCREQIRQWQAYSIRYNQRIVSELEPLRARFQAAQREMALLIDELLTRPTRGRRLRKVERAKLRDLLLTLVDGLSDGTDEQLETLRAKHGGAPDPQAEHMESDLLRGLLEDALGFELDPEAAARPEELLWYAERKMREGYSQEEGPRSRRRGRRAKASQGGSDGIGAARAAQPAAGGGNGAAEVRPLRDIFRKLASALHPDREPDEETRKRKTLLMQRVNQAYGANDLLALLTLQLEIEQIDAAHLSSLPAERLAHYNRILRGQLKELEAELRRDTEPFRHMVEAAGRRVVTTAGVDRQLSAEVAELRAALRELREDLVAFRDPDRLRERLEGVTTTPALDDPDELAAFAELASLAEFFSGPAPRRRRAPHRRRR